MMRLVLYLKPYWKATVLAPLLMLLEVVMDLMQPTLMAGIVDRGVMTGDTGYIVRTGGLMVLTALVGAVGGMGCTWFSSVAGINFGTDLRRDIFRKVQSFSFSNLDNFQTASLITRLTNDVSQVQMVVQACLRILVRAPLLVVGGVAMAVAIDAHLATIILVALPFLGFSLYIVISKGFPLFSAVQARLDKVNAVVRENLAGVRVVKAFVRAEYECGRFGRVNQDLTDVSISATRLMGATMPIMMLVMHLSIVAVLWFGGVRVDAGRMQVGEVMAFINYMTQILFSLMMIAFFLMMISRAKASTMRLNEVLSTGADICDAPGASDEPVLSGRIAFEKVAFRYPDTSGPPVLQDINLHIEPGETIAILGSTGSGKSSLVNLIPRFYDVAEGRIVVDGRDIRDISLPTLRGAIGVALQESILLSGTIRENLRWGCETATDDELVAAAQTAQAHDFISSFPQGYDTVVGQRGVTLSGGQKQRLCIARALLTKPKILILDDSTSAVDMGTEARMQEALRRLIRESLPGCTCIVIAQRISTVMDADRIVVLEDGRITAIGTHAYLLKASPVYQEIWQSQVGKEAV